MPRAFLVVMDSVGCGGAPDAAEFGDAGSNTLGHIAQACAEGLAEIGRSGPLKMPNVIPRLCETPGRIDHPGPELGAHNREIYLGELGLTEAALEELTRDGIV